MQRMEDAVVPMASTALEAGQLETARRLFHRLMEVDSTSVEARMGLGDVAMRERDASSAARWYSTAFAVARMPNERHAARLAHGRAVLADGRLEEARQSFESLLDSRSAVAQTTIAWAYNGVGLTLLLEGDMPGAAKAMEQAVLRAPDDTRIQNNHRRVLAMLGDPPPAIEREGRSKEPGTVSEEALAEFDVAPADRVSRIGSTARRYHSQPVGANKPEPGVESTGQTLDKQVGDVQPQHENAGTSAEETGGKRHPAGTATDAEKSLDSASRHGTVRTESRETPPLHRTVGDAKIAGALAERVDVPQPGEYVETTSLRDESSPLFAAKRIELRRRDPAQVALADSGRNAPGHVDVNGPADGMAAGGSATSPSSEFEKSGGLTETPGDSPEPIETESPDRSAGGALSGVRAFVVENKGSTFLQLGSYTKPENAARVVARLRGLTDHPVNVFAVSDSAENPMHRVRVGPIASHDALLELIGELERRGCIIENAPVFSSRAGGGYSRFLPTLKPLTIRERGGLYLQTGYSPNLDTANVQALKLRSLTDRPVQISELSSSDGEVLHSVRIGPIEADDPLRGVFDFGD